MISKIYILESIPKNELQTGEELYNDTISRYNLLYDSNIETHFAKIEGKNELFSTLNTILENAEIDDEIILHIEAHGNELVMGLRNNETVTWNQLTDYLIPINRKTKNKLHLNLAACFSMHAGLSVDLTKTAPYKSYTSTIEKISAGEILADNTSFYDNIIKSKDIYKAYVDFESSNPNTKLRIKDVETVLDFHLIPTLTMFAKSGSISMLKSFFDPYLNIQIDIDSLRSSNNSVEYILRLFKTRFMY